MEGIMGRTLLTSTQIIERTKSDWERFRRALRKEDQYYFDKVFELSKIHIQAIANSDMLYPLEAILLSILIEQQKKIELFNEQFKKEGVLIEENLFD